MGKKKHRPKSKAELLREQLERERPRPPRPAAGWMQAAERSNRALAELVLKQERAKLKEEARKLVEEEARRMEEGGTGEAFTISAEAVARAPEVLPDAGRKGPAIGGLRVAPKIPGKQNAGKGAVLPSAILGGKQSAKNEV